MSFAVVQNGAVRQVLQMDVAFSGMIWVEDTTGAVVRLILEIDGNANLNFIDKIRIRIQSYCCSISWCIINPSTRAV